MNNYIKTIITANKNANINIAALEETISTKEVSSEKDKANFGNLCIALKGFRMVAEATECLLFNEDVLKDDNGNYYQKIEEPIVPPSTEDKKGSDFDVDGTRVNQ